MTDLQKILGSLGGLHDAVVHRIVWTPEKNILEFEVDDFYSNFEGLPEYPGPLSGSLVLQGVEHVHFDVETGESRLNVDEFVVAEAGSGGFTACVTFWPTGRITARFRSATHPNLISP